MNKKAIAVRLATKGRSFLRMLKRLPSRVFDVLDVIILYPTLFLIFIISSFASLPELGQLVSWVSSVFQGKPHAIEAPTLEGLVLPLLSLMAIILVRHISTSQEALSNVQSGFDAKVSTIIDSVAGVELLEFKTDTELKAYLNRRTRAAKRCVDDFTWAHRKRNTVRMRPKRTESEEYAWRVLEEEHADIVHEVSQTRHYREVFVLSRHDRITKLQRRMKEASPYYQCVVLEDCNIPRLQFVVVDEKEAIFVSDNHKVLCSIKHPRFMRILLDYFDDAWTAGTELVRLEDNRARWNLSLTNELITKANAELDAHSALISLSSQFLERNR